MSDQIIKNASISEMRCVESRDRITNLEQKLARLETARSKLEGIIEAASQKKQAAVDQFVNADSSPEDVKEAENECSAVAQELKNIEGLLETVDQEIDAEKNRLVILERERAHNAANVWNLIYSRMAQNLLKSMSHEILFLYAASKMQRRPLDYRGFFESLFPEPNKEAMIAVAPDLDTLYKEVLLGDAKKGKKGK